MRCIAFAMCLLFSTSAFGAIEKPILDLKLLPFVAESKEAHVPDLYSLLVPSISTPGKIFDLARDVNVRGYYKSNGTYVQPHHRSAPDGNPYNNYSYPGNLNPYTGKIAPGNPSSYLGRNSGSYGLNKQSSYGLGNSSSRSSRSGLWGFGGCDGD